MLCFLIVTIAITISTAVIAFVSGIAVGAYANNEVVEKHNLLATTDQLDISRQLKLMNESKKLQSDDHEKIREPKDAEFISHIIINALFTADKQCSKSYISSAAERTKSS